ncbi:PucR family transcriptional regulator [Arthrobacter sp. Y-9]|uniref:PucR family transcriptional regulator n=1 Tax=Arthrobacter sp. Y-9 TaxID=3039385 RepID=UPI00241E891C|nr:PucR family transcriptional regulator [Arthrobacter sp. Y-9]WFR84215.1 PucR family transcriptional regulator [Arthrobacter sp. Y-9]
MTAASFPFQRPLTVRDALDLDALRAGSPEVLAGEAGLDTPVRWVHIAEEAEASSLLEGGELVLTTGLAFRHSADLTRIFLERYQAAGAAAVAVELVDDDGAPDARAAAHLRTAAGAVACPLILLTRRVRFVQVTEEAHRALMDHQVRRLERARHVHEVFTALSVGNAGESRIVEATAALLDSPVVFEDPAHLVLSYSARDRDPARLLDGWADRSRFVGYRNQTAFGTGGDRWLQTPVGLTGQRWGRLVAPEFVPESAPEEPGGSDGDGDGSGRDLADAFQVLERAGQALTMARMAGRDRREVLFQARSGLIQDLRQATPPDEQEALARATALGLSRGAAYVPLVARLESGGTSRGTDAGKDAGAAAGSTSAAEAPDATEVQLRERAFLDALQAWAHSSRQSVLASSLHAGSVAILLPLAALELEDSALHRLAAAPQLAGFRWTLGAGRAERSLVAAARGLDDADQVAETAATLGSRHLPFYRFADIRLRGLLALLGEDSRVKAFAQSELGPLLEPGRAPALQLLRDYLAHGGNMTSLAKARNVSRQALYAHVKSLQDLLGLPLEDPESRASLTVALLWHDLTGA